MTEVTRRATGKPRTKDPGALGIHPRATTMTTTTNGDNDQRGIVCCLSICLLSDLPRCRRPTPPRSPLPRSNQVEAAADRLTFASHSRRIQQVKALLTSDRVSRPVGHHNPRTVSGFFSLSSFFFLITNEA